MTPLIDATEMYLRTVWELEEEGVTPIRARLVERLGLSAPAVSETVARLAAEGLMQVGADRTLELTDAGREIAISVMRKHRLAELLLIEVIGLEWEEVHNEACRWEHVISDSVEQRLVELLESPDTCPHGNPIPGLASAAEPEEFLSLGEAAKAGATATIARFSEKLQSDVETMRSLREAGLRPGAKVALAATDDGVTAEVDGARLDLPAEVAAMVYVQA
jgi:DtxR family transcriptional regulator, Mn-dependent transcriptional regulator